MDASLSNRETARLQEARSLNAPWRKWGPYLSERQWGTVREDYSKDGNAWEYFNHDQARSRAYRWGEDGLAGISDDKQRLCFALALWNGKDTILKERLFGLSNGEGNHGEDVKECYYYLDCTPTHSYMKYLYKYPQRSFPYDDLVQTNRARTRLDREYELLDTGIFADDRYFDVFVEYVKNTTEDILIRITVCNRGPEASSIHVLPTIWFRNTWTFSPGTPKPVLKRAPGTIITAAHSELGDRFLYVDGDVPLLFTENETNNERLFAEPNAGPYVKDGINESVVSGSRGAVDPEQRGTKASAHFQIKIAAGAATTIQLRLSDQNPSEAGEPFGKNFDDIFRRRRAEADEFYENIVPPGSSADTANVMRQALGGMLWSKQYFGYDLNKWLKEHDAGPEKQTVPAPVRNREWFHMVNEHIISMPDKWEYPWYAAWDLAFHAIALATVDTEFAKDQLELLLHRTYLHPTGQIPAYEWNFSDVNPPVHAWATMFVYKNEQALHGKGDSEFLHRSFRKLMLNFTWWVNRKDRFGKNVFEGGFLGLDNIGVFDRSAPLPAGGYLEQADGTAWMALYCQNMIEMSAELAATDSTCDDMGAKFIDHFLWIARAMNHMGPSGMWDEKDGFYYDVLRFPDGSATRLKVRSLVGLLPVCAVTVTEEWQRDLMPLTVSATAERLRQLPDLLESIHPTGPGNFGVNDRGILALVNKDRLRRILTRMLDENEFLSPHGLRALSRHHLEHPYVFNLQDKDYSVGYVPAESDSAMFGGNSNWRGPVWMPTNVLLIRALLTYYLYYGDSFRIECPTGFGNSLNLFEVAREIARRLASIFLRDENGRRPVFGGSEKLQTDPHWKDYLLFYEYFHGDNGSGVGANHQTGWTGTVATMIEIFGRVSAEEFLAGGSKKSFAIKVGATA